MFLTDHQRTFNTNGNLPRTGGIVKHPKSCGIRTILDRRSLFVTIGGIGKEHFESQYGSVESIKPEALRSMMIQPNLDSAAFKELLKEALAETLDENRELLHEVFAEVLEDIALAEAIQKGQQTERASRDEIFDVLEDPA